VTVPTLADGYIPAGAERTSTVVAVVGWSRRRTPIAVSGRTTRERATPGCVG
jgi:hypothetical protein